MICGYPSPAVDVVVVGAGVIGLATAWELRRRGLGVAVVDPDPGQGASRAAAGMIAPTSEVRFQQQALHRLMHAAAAAYPDFVQELEQATGVDVGYLATETLVCAAEPADRQALSDLRDHQVSVGMDVEVLTSRAARALEPALSPRLAGAFRVPGDHQVDPRRLVGGLLTALGIPRSVGSVRMVAGAAAALLTTPEGRVTGVALSDGTRVEASETVLASGVGPDRIDGLPAGARLPVRPVHGDILRTRLPDGAPRLLERTVRGVVGGRPVYLVPRADGEVVIGATEREDGNDHPSAGGVHRLLHDAQALVPGVADLELHEVMARARPGSPDDLPFLGRVTEDGGPVRGLVVSTGYFRHGVLLAPMAARLTADLVTGATATAADVAHLTAVDPGRSRTKGAAPFVGHDTSEVPA